MHSRGDSFGKLSEGCRNLDRPASFEAEISWPTVERLTDDSVIEHI
jgi:hypothetical protein